MPIQFAIEGTNADAAAKALLEIPGISGNCAALSDNQKSVTLAMIATVVGIVGGTLTIAEKIQKWYSDYKKSKSGKELGKVLIIGKDGKRLSLDGATVEQIKKVLETL